MKFVDSGRVDEIPAHKLYELPAHLREVPFQVKTTIELNLYVKFDKNIYLFDIQSIGCGQKSEKG